MFLGHPVINRSDFGECVHFLSQEMGSCIICKSRNGSELATMHADVFGTHVLLELETMENDLSLERTERFPKRGSVLTIE